MKFIAAAFLSLFATCALAGNVTVSWTPPTECDDGSTLANCPTTGYEIWMGSSQTGTYTKVNVSPAADATSYRLSNVLAGTRCFLMKTLSNTLTSAESNRICVTVPVSGPKAPFINVTVAVGSP